MIKALEADNRPLRGNMKSGKVEHTCNLGTWEMEAGESGVQGWPHLHSEAET